MGGQRNVFEPFSFIPDLGMLVLVAGASPELESLLLARFGTGGQHTEAWNVERGGHEEGLMTPGGRYLTLYYEPWLAPWGDGRHELVEAQP